MRNDNSSWIATGGALLLVAGSLAPLIINRCVEHLNSLGAPVQQLAVVECLFNLTATILEVLGFACVAIGLTWSLTKLTKRQ